jgi:hypothetical protein
MSWAVTQAMGDRAIATAKQNTQKKRFLMRKS